MKTLLAVGAGGFLGALARFAVHEGMARLVGTAVPIGTLAVNVVGSFALGVLVGLAELTDLSPTIRLGVGVGVLGAFTTFSTFSVDTLSVAARSGMSLATLNVAANVTLAIAAAAAGLQLSRGW